MVKTEKNRLLKCREYSKKYRAKTLNKTKKFLSVRFSKEEGEEIKKFIKEHNIPIKRIIEEGTQIMLKEYE